MGLLRRSLELGAAAWLLTKEAADELIEDLTKDGGMEREKADSLLADLRRRGQEVRDDIAESIRSEVDEATKRAGLVRKSELDALRTRVEALERRLSEVEGLRFEPTTEI